MALTLATSGSQLTNGTEQEIINQTSLNHFATYIFANAMQNGDRLTIRVFVKDDQGAITRKYLDVEIIDAQITPAVFIPFVPATQYRITIQRTGGSDRTYNFSLFTA